jgi:hypothetical protein
MGELLGMRIERVLKPFFCVVGESREGGGEGAWSAIEMNIGQWNENWAEPLWMATGDRRAEEREKGSASPRVKAESGWQ